jgi:hypothetical protein
MSNDFGPNQEEVDRLLERLEHIDHDQAMFLASFGGDDLARERARSALRQAAQASGRERQLEKAQDEVTRWVNTWFSGGHQISGYGRDITPAQAAVGAAPMVFDAIGALVLRDLLPTEDFEVLSEPWRELLATD